MNPVDVLQNGARELEAVLGAHKFEFIQTGAGASAGGHFACGEYRRGDRRLELHVWYSLGMVRCHVDPVGGLTALVSGVRRSMSGHVHAARSKRHSKRPQAVQSRRRCFAVPDELAVGPTRLGTGLRITRAGAAIVSRAPEGHLSARYTEAPCPDMLRRSGAPLTRDVRGGWQGP